MKAAGAHTAAEAAITHTAPCSVASEEVTDERD
jgi:hypothetical protein